jgi:hypothetical protein
LISDQAGADAGIIGINHRIVPCRSRSAVQMWGFTSGPEYHTWGRIETGREQNRMRALHIVFRCRFFYTCLVRKRLKRRYILQFRVNQIASSLKLLKFRIGTDFAYTLPVVRCAEKLFQVVSKNTTGQDDEQDNEFHPDI